PELEQSPRYLDVRFWRQVSAGAPRREVEVLLEEPQERTIDPALMAVLAERHWDEIGRKAKEAWVYYGWVIYFDDAEVVDMVRRPGGCAPRYDCAGRRLGRTPRVERPHGAGAQLGRAGPDRDADLVRRGDVGAGRGSRVPGRGAAPRAAAVVAVLPAGAIGGR